MGQLLQNMPLHQEPSVFFNLGILPRETFAYTPKTLKQLSFKMDNHRNGVGGLAAGGRRKRKNA